MTDEFFKSTNEDKTEFRISPKISWAVALIILVCLQLLAAFINLPASFWPFAYNFTLPLSFIFGGSVAIFILMNYLGVSFLEIVKPIGKKSTIWIFLLSIFFFLFSLPFTEFLTSLVPTSGVYFLEKLYKTVSEGFEMLLDYKISGFITVCIIAPIFEEILFRGILLRGLLQNKTNPVWAIILSSLLFGLAHLNPWQFLGAGFLGAIFGYVYYRTKALWISIVLHALNNSISFLMMVKYKSMDENLTNSTDYLSIGICSIIALLIGYVIFQLTKNTSKWI